ncbi:PspC domain-containing protein [Niallia sp. FSL W8-0635]|uniref:PspC domain-containing protein n=1 Tax=Niallia sp. FSL W8-0635 TaxID=2975337 RepID=UPI0009CA3EA8|nr:phage shock protein C [Mycobacteroides abscessus subsp. abscessus]HEO8419261.1 PspC domain-containing protein [Yersinia enterocolitica]
MNRKMRKSQNNKSIYGVCGGIGEYFGITPLGIRLIFLLTMPISILIYIILVNSMADSPRTL